MEKTIEVTLSLPLVTPLTKVIRELCAQPRFDGPLPEGAEPRTPTPLPGSPNEAKRARARQADLFALLALFPPGFSEDGVIRIDRFNARGVLRACADLRLQVRAQRMSAFADDTLQNGAVDYEGLAEPLRSDYATYFFLGTLQETILRHFDPLFPETAGASGLYAPTAVQAGKGLKRLGRALRRALTSRAAASADTWSVVVLNDPVNHMSYVQSVFQGELDLPAETARSHMMEVHERGRAVVWRGPRAQAEAHRGTLQTWHLSTVVEPDET